MRTLWTRLHDIHTRLHVGRATEACCAFRLRVVADKLPSQELSFLETQPPNLESRVCIGLIMANLSTENETHMSKTRHLCRELTNFHGPI